MLTMFKRLASLIPTPATNKVTLFVSDTGIPSYKDEAGLVTPMSGQPIPAGYIDGLKMEWVSGTQIRFTSGSAYIPSLGRALALAAAVTKTPTLAASTWYHAYLYSNAGTPDVEVTTTAPDTPYSGTARTKAGDTSRRYIGSFRTDGSSLIYNFIVQGPQQIYMQEVPRSVSGGTSTTFISVSLSALVPMVSRSAIAAMTNNGSAAARFRPASSGFTGSTRMYGLTAGAFVVGPLPTDTSQNIEYQVDAGGLANLDVIGFTVER